MKTQKKLRTVWTCWKDIGYAVLAEVFEYHLDVKAYSFYLWRDPGEGEWNGVMPVGEGEAPLGFAFNREDSASTPDPVFTAESAQVFLHGFVKWDQCSNWHFDEQDNVMLHFCGKEAAANVGVLLGRIYDMAAELIPHWGC